MIDEQLKNLCDYTTEAHTRIQKDYQDINPVVGVSQKMREAGIAADAMTIDCLRTGKRIIVILQDAQPDIVFYQFSFKDKDPDDSFEQLNYSELNPNVIYEWMKGYFSTMKN